MTSWGRWLLPAIWGVLILVLSSRPSTFFFSEAEARRHASAHHSLEIATHLVEFGVFSLLVARPLHSWELPRAAVLASAFAAVLILSLLNESIQALTPTRMFDVWDMAVDVLGGAIGVLLVMASDKRKGDVPRPVELEN